ncbi:MAG: hypothetical protein ACOYT4_00055 [Nanoarchaeota archaeon]
MKYKNFLKTAVIYVGIVSTIAGTPKISGISDHISKSATLHKITNTVTYPFRSSFDFVDPRVTFADTGDFLPYIKPVNYMSIKVEKPKLPQNFRELKEKTLEEKIREDPNKIDLAQFKVKKNKELKNDPDVVLLARLLYGEGRDCPEKEQKIIAYTAQNRLRLSPEDYGLSLQSVMLMPAQYSCFNSSDPNLKKLKNPAKYEPEAFRTSLKLAQEVLDEGSNDTEDLKLRYITHYHVKGINPDWAPYLIKVRDISGITEKELSHKYYMTPQAYKEYRIALKEQKQKEQAIQNEIKRLDKSKARIA